MNRAQKRDIFIENLEKFRSEHGYSGTEMARLLKVKRAQWDRWKNNRIGMTLSSAHRLVESFNETTGSNWTLGDWLQDKLPEEKK